MTGIQTVLNKLNLKLMEIENAAPKLAERAGRVIEKRAKENLTGKNNHQRHIITGNLRRSIDTRVTKTGPFTVTISIGTDMHYAIYVELRDRTGGFLYPALYESKDEAITTLALLIAGKIK